MSREIDEKVVQVKFDNREFEQNTKTTMNTLTAFKKHLDFTGAVKGVDEFGKATKSVDMSGLERSIETVRTKFSALQIVGVTALSRIANDAITTGKQVASSLTIQPISSGFHEYELKMGSIQTIMASTGASLEKVNGYLNELNTYSDKTIYSFSDMTSNIGKFTNAGVKLKDSVAAIKGVSNEAAVSGANAEEASRAMYNFAQALSAGYVKLIDWKSIETANMATVEFKNELLKTAIACKTVKDVGGGMYKTLTTDANGKTSEAFNATKKFNEALSNQWMTTEVLTKTLGRYADETTGIGKKAFAAAQDVKTFTQLFDTLKESAGSGWAQTWEITVGDFNQAKKLFTEMSNTFGTMINKSAKARNALISSALRNAVSDEDWKKLETSGVGGQTFQNALKNTAKKHGVAIDQMIEQEGSFKKSLSEGWLTSNIYNETLKDMEKASGGTSKASKENAEALHQLAKSAKEANTPLGELSNKMGRTSGRDLLIDSLRNSLKGLLKVLGTVKNAYRDVFPATTGDQLYGIINGIHEFSKKLIISDASADKLRRTFKGLFSIINIFTTITGGALKFGIKLLAKLFGITGDNILDLTAALGDAISKFRDFLFENNLVIKVLSKAAGGILSFGRSVAAWFNAFKRLPKVQDNIVKMGSAFKGTGGNLKTFFGGGLVVISEFIKRVRALDGLTLANIRFVAQDFSKNVLGYFKNIGGCFTSFRTVFSVFGMSIKNSLAVAQGPLGAFMRFISKFVGFFKGIDIEDVIAVGFGIALIKTVNTLSKAISTLSDLVSPLKSLAGVFDETRGVLKAYAREIKAKALLKIAEAVAILAASVFLLAQLDPKKMWGAVGALTALGTGLALFVKVIGSSEKVGSVGKVALLIVGMCVGLLIITRAISTIAKIPVTDLKKAGVVIVAIFGVYAGMMAATKLMGKFSINASQFGIGMLAMCAALYVVAIAIRKIAKIPVTDLVKAGLVVAGMMELFAGMMVASNFAGEFSGRAGRAILAMSASLLLIALAMKAIGRMDVGSIMKAMITISALFGLFGVLMVESMVAGQYAARAGVMILLISGALVLMVGVIALMAKIPLGDILKAGAVVSGLMVFFALVIAASNFAGKNAAKAGVMLLGMAGTLLILTVVIKLLSKLDPAPLWNAVAAVSVLMLMFNVVIRATRLAQDCKSTLIILTGAILAITLAMKVMSTMSPEKLKAVTVSLSGLMLAFSLLIAATSLAKKATLTIVLISGVVAGLGAMLYGLSQLPIGSTLETAKSLSLLLISMSACIVVLGLIPVEGSAMAVASLAIFIGGLAAIIAAIGALTRIDGFNELMQDGGKMLAKMGYYLGNFAGSIVGGFTAGATSGLPAVGKNLSDFMKNAAPFFSGIKLIDGVSMAGVKCLAESVLLLTASSIMDRIASFLTGSGTMVSFGEQICLFAPKLKEFATVTAGLDGNVVKNAAFAASALAAFADKVPKSGGALQALTGEINLESFGNSICAFAPKLKEFADKVKGLDGNAVSNAGKAAETISAFAEKIPKSGGALQAFTGEVDLVGFGNSICAFAPSLMRFAGSVKGLDANVVLNAAKAAQSIGAFASVVPPTGGWKQGLLGEVDLTNFGNQINQFAPGLVQFANTTKGLDANVVIHAAKAGEAISKFAETVGKTGGALQGLLGEVDLGSFGSQLRSLGPGLVSFAESSKSVDGESIKKGIKSTALLMEFVSKLPKSGGLGDALFGSQDAGKFGDGLNALGVGITSMANAITRLIAVAGQLEALKIPEAEKVQIFGECIKKLSDGIVEYSDSIEDIDVGKMSAIGSQISSLMSLIGSTKNIDTSGLSTFKGAIAKLGDSGVSAFISKFTAGKTRIQSIGSELIMSLCNGMKSKKILVNLTTSGIITTITNLVRGARGSMEQAGQYLAEGLEKGIQTKSSGPISAAKRMALAVERMTRSTFQVKSPSRIFIKIGQYLALGLAAGIANNADKAVASGKNLAHAVNSTVRKSMDSIEQVVNNGLDFSPSIHPVMDLSAVKSGTNAINGLLRDRTLNIGASIADIKAHVNGNQNGSNDQLISAINKLRSDIKDIPGNTYTVNGISYDNGTNIASAVEELINAVVVEGRV